MVMRGGLLSRRTAQRFRQAVISAVGPVKIKLLLFCCRIFALIVFGSRMESFMGWKDHTDLDRASAPRKGYALLINTWKRNDLLKQSISHYKSCRGLDSIHIVWSEPEPLSDNLVKFLNQTVHTNARDGRQIKLKFDINKEDSLNSRFKEIKDL